MSGQGWDWLGEATERDRTRWLRYLDMTGGPDACWEWQGSRSPEGYGRTGLQVAGKRRAVAAHRAVYRILTGKPLAPDVFLLHSCDNPPCCNPAHLRPGTHLENMQDRKRHGAGYARGADHHKAVKHLTDEDVAAIRAAHKWHTHGRGAGTFAARYGVSKQVIRDILAHEGRWTA